MDLGNFSLSLSVKDLKLSRRFYEKLGFSVIGGESSQGWLILQSSSCTIGLFQGMFEDNVLTWNPPDARAIQSHLKENGVPIDYEATGFDGPATVMLTDPDGNQIMLDQF